MKNNNLTWHPSDLQIMGPIIINYPNTCFKIFMNDTKFLYEMFISVQLTNY